MAQSEIRNCEKDISVTRPIRINRNQSTNLFVEMWLIIDNKIEQ